MGLFVLVEMEFWLRLASLPLHLLHYLLSSSWSSSSCSWLLIQNNDHNSDQITLLFTLHFCNAKYWGIVNSVFRPTLVICMMAVMVFPNLVRKEKNKRERKNRFEFFRDVLNVWMNKFVSTLTEVSFQDMLILKWFIGSCSRTNWKIFSQYLDSVLSWETFWPLGIRFLWTIPMKLRRSECKLWNLGETK